METAVTYRFTCYYGGQCYGDLHFDTSKILKNNHERLIKVFKTFNGRDIHFPFQNLPSSTGTMRHRLGIVSLQSWSHSASSDKNTAQHTVQFLPQTEVQETKDKYLSLIHI